MDTNELKPMKLTCGGLWNLDLLHRMAEVSKKKTDTLMNGGRTGFSLHVTILGEKEDDGIKSHRNSWSKYLRYTAPSQLTPPAPRDAIPTPITPPVMPWVI